jgi:hypothetical protein
VQSVKTRQLIAYAHAALAAESPMTLRQLFYRLVSTEALENSHADYVRLSRVMTRAREDGEIDFKDIVDRSRPEYQPNVWDHLPGYLTAVGRSFRRDLWEDQPCHVEIWVEKDAIIGAIEDLAVGELGVTVRVGRGFMSATRCHEIADLFASIAKPIHVFYLGDHDPSGRCIETELYDRVRRYGSGDFEMRRLSIHETDIRLFHLPPLKVKPTDSRAKRFKREYGGNCVELDALPPNELRRRIKEAVHDLIDWEAWNRATCVEAAEKESLVKIVTRMKMGRNGHRPTGPSRSRTRS